MKLLVIVLCLLFERFLVRVRIHNRFYWFNRYVEKMETFLNHAFFSSSWIKLLVIILPPLIVVGLILHGLGHLLFGFIGFMLNVFILYYCLGPENSFYPVRETDLEINENQVDLYLGSANQQLFAPLFWYILGGPLVVLLYRLLALCQQDLSLNPASSYSFGILDWLPTRLTALLYLFVGNFQNGFPYFSSHFFSHPSNNQLLVREVGVFALDLKAENVTMAKAERLVEHGLVVLLALYAIATISVWIEWV